jgi:ferric-dicitrate binding protein FerR (iron transport regulator)
MRRRRARSFPLAIVGLAFAALCAPALMASQSAGWSVVVANNAFVDHGKGDAASAAVMGANIGTGDRLTTGDGGALVLTRGEDLVTMAENSQIEIVDPQPSSTTLIEQPYGHVEYHVTKEKVPHFQVDAPLLATVVKGTTFSVDSSLSKSSVTVKEGRVVAKNRSTGASNSVGAGERGAVESGGRGVDVGSAPSNGNASAASASSNASSSGNGSSGNGNSGNGNSGHGNAGNGNGGGNGNSGGSGNGKSNGGDNGDGKGKGHGRNK